MRHRPRWLGDLFDQDHIDGTETALVASQGSTGGSAGQEAARIPARKRAADAEAWLRRFQAAIEACVDPAATVEASRRTG